MFDNRDMLDFDDHSSELLFTSCEVDMGVGVARYNHDNTDVAVILEGIPGSNIDYDTALVTPQALCFWQSNGVVGAVSLN